MPDFVFEADATRSSADKRAWGVGLTGMAWVLKNKGQYKLNIEGEGGGGWGPVLARLACGGGSFIVNMGDVL